MKPSLMHESYARFHISIKIYALELLSCALGASEVMSLY